MSERFSFSGEFMDSIRAVFSQEQGNTVVVCRNHSFEVSREHGFELLSKWDQWDRLIRSGKTVSEASAIMDERKDVEAKDISSAVPCTAENEHLDENDVVVHVYTKRGDVYRTKYTTRGVIRGRQALLRHAIKHMDIDVTIERFKQDE